MLTSNSEYGRFLQDGDNLKRNPICLGDISRRTWSILTYENITELRPKHEKKYKLYLFDQRKIITLKKGVDTISLKIINNSSEVELMQKYLDKICCIWPKNKKSNSNKNWTSQW